MSTIIPEGASLRQAIEWINDELQAGKNRYTVVNDGIYRFDLNPIQSEFVTNLYIHQNLSSFPSDNFDFEDDDVTVNQTEVEFEVCPFYEDSFFGDKSLDDMISNRIEVSYSPDQNIIMLSTDTGEIYIRPEAILKIAERLKSR